MDRVFIPSTWSRLFAHGIDQMISLVLYIPFAGLVLKLLLSEEDVFLSLPQLLALFLLPAVYEFVFLVLMQTTPGKWMFGLKVVPFSNPTEPLKWTQCLLRPLVSRLSFFFGWAIFATAFFRYDRTHVSDWVAETRVIQNEPRKSLPKVRWIVGTFFILIYLYEGMISASAVINAIDWSAGRVNVRQLLELGDAMDAAEEFY